MTPGEGELASRELQQANESLAAAKVLMAAGLLTSGASRLYYAAFHSARAALTLKGAFSKTHSGLIGLYVKNFGPAPLLQELFRLRQLADYSEKSIKIESEELQGKIEETAKFLRACSDLVAEALREGPDEPDPPPDR